MIRTYFNNGDLHISPSLALANPRDVAQALLYECSNNHGTVFEALALLLACNRNEMGRNISAVVTTALLPVNRQPFYIFKEEYFSQSICQHLSREQIATLQNYNATHLKNQPPNEEMALIREVFGPSAIENENEGNSYLAHFFRLGSRYASSVALEAPDSMPTIKIERGPTLPLATLSMCLNNQFMPLMRHDGSHISTGYDTGVIGEICNQTYDLAVNAMAQYGVFPDMEEQRLNRRVIYSFFGLPENLKGLQRDWKEFVIQSLETWRIFFKENPEYAERWQLTDLLDADMRMIKPDGTPIISEQTKEQQIPIIDYTDLAILRHLRPKLINLLDDDEVYASMPYDLLYVQMLQATELLSCEYVLRNGAPPILVNGLYDACATFGNIRFGDLTSPALSHLSSKEPNRDFTREDIGMRRRRSRAQDFGEWWGYLVDVGQDHDKKVWVTEKPPCLSFIYPDAMTVYRVNMPCHYVHEATHSGSFFGGSGYLVNGEGLRIDSTLSIRNDKKIFPVGSAQFAKADQDDINSGRRGVPNLIKTRALTVYRGPV